MKFVSASDTILFGNTYSEVTDLQHEIKLSDAQSPTGFKIGNLMK